MARYQDYVKDEPEDVLETEIEQAQVASEKREEEGFKIPERFKDKGPEDIAKSYVELEQLYSRQAQDLGNWRKTVDELISLKSPTIEPENPDPEPEVPVSIDDLYADPEGTVSKVVDKRVRSDIDALRQELNQTKTEKAVAELTTKHPNWREVAKTPEFMGWVQEKSYRSRLAAEADQFDFEAADALFTMYDDLNAQEKVKEKTTTRRKQLADGALESSSPSSATFEEEFSRTNIIEAKLHAAKGDESAIAWLKNNSRAIQAAYQERRIID